MTPFGGQYLPVAPLFFLALLAICATVILLFEFEVLTYAYLRMGIHPRYVFTVLFLSLIGSYVNIPVAQLPGEHVVHNSIVYYFGIPYMVPTESHWPGTIIAVNVGGALIPTLLSFYLILKNDLYIRSIIGVIVVAIVVNHLAEPVRGLGIKVPIFIPPLVAGATATILAWRKAPALAYICGSLGTLIGADLMNLYRIPGLGAPIASIGGAGTFDGIFLTGIIAVLLPPMGGPRRARR